MSVELLLPLVVERLVGALRRPVRTREELPVLLTVGDAEDRLVLRELEVEGASQQLAHVALVAPAEGAAHALRRRRQEWAHHPEHLSEPPTASSSRARCDLPASSPARARRRSPHDRGRTSRRRWRARRRRRRPRRTSPPRPQPRTRRHALFRGSFTSGVDESGREIHPDDLCAAPRGKDRGRARSRRRVEHPLSGLWVCTLHDDRVQVANRVRDALVGPFPHITL